MAGRFLTVFRGFFAAVLGRGFAGGRIRGRAATCRSIFGAAFFAVSGGFRSGFFFGFATIFSGFSGFAAFFGAACFFSGFGAGPAARVSSFFSGVFFGFATGLGVGLVIGGSGFFGFATGASGFFGGTFFFSGFGTALAICVSGFFAGSFFFGFSACRSKARGSISTRCGVSDLGFGAGAAFSTGFGRAGGAVFRSAVTVFAGAAGLGFSTAVLGNSGAAGFASAAFGGSGAAGFASAAFGGSGAGGFGSTGFGSTGRCSALRSRATGFSVVSRSASGLRAVFGFGFSPLPVCVISDRRTISTVKLRDAFAGGFVSQGSPSATVSTTSV